MLSFFDQGKRKIVLNMLSLGLSRRSAARYIGCSPTTINSEINRNRQFAREVMQAEAGFEARHRARIDKASEDPARWRASVWSLERKYPDEYMPRQPRTVSPAQVEQILGQFAAILVAQIPDDGQREQVTRALWKVIDESVVQPKQEQLPHVTPENSADV